MSLGELGGPEIDTLGGKEERENKRRVKTEEAEGDITQFKLLTTETDETKLA